MILRNTFRSIMLPLLTVSLSIEGLNRNCEIRFTKVQKRSGDFFIQHNTKNVQLSVLSNFYVTKLLINCAEELKQRLDFLRAKSNTFAFPNYSKTKNQFYDEKFTATGCFFSDGSWSLGTRRDHCFAVGKNN